MVNSKLALNCAFVPYVFDFCGVIYLILVKTTSYAFYKTCVEGSVPFANRLKLVYNMLVFLKKIN